MKKILIILITFIFASFAIAQSVIIKDDNGNTLIQINDEGNLGGSITIPIAGDVGPGHDKLINIQGESTVRVFF